MELGSIDGWITGVGTVALVVVTWLVARKRPKIELRVVGEVREFQVNGVTEKLPVLSITNKTDHIVTITKSYWSCVLDSHVGLPIYLNHPPLSGTDLKAFPFALQKGEMGQVLIANQDFKQWIRDTIKKHAGRTDTLMFAGNIRFYAIHSAEANAFIEGQPTGELYGALKQIGQLLRKPPASTPQKAKR